MYTTSAAQAMTANTVRRILVGRVQSLPINTRNVRASLCRRVFDDKFIGIAALGWSTANKLSSSQVQMIYNSFNKQVFVFTVRQSLSFFIGKHSFVVQFKTTPNIHWDN